MMTLPILTPILIALGATLGALSRYYITLVCTQKWGNHFPYGTLIVNQSGALLIGICVVILSFDSISPLKTLMMVGFLGGYTTFSTYQLETSHLLKSKKYKHALLYGLGSPLMGFIAVEIGIFIGNNLLLPR